MSDKQIWFEAEQDERGVLDVVRHCLRLGASGYIYGGFETLDDGRVWIQAYKKKIEPKQEEFVYKDHLELLMERVNSMEKNQAVLLARAAKEVKAASPTLQMVAATNKARAERAGVAPGAHVTHACEGKGCAHCGVRNLEMRKISKGQGS